MDQGESQPCEFQDQAEELDPPKKTKETPRYSDTLKGANWEFVGIDKEYSYRGLVNILRRIEVEISEVGKKMTI